MPVLFFYFLLSAMILLSGCQLWTSGSSEVTAKKNLLDPVVPSLDVVQLDIVFAQRHADDPLLKSMIWEELDQVGTVSLDSRAKLMDQGFRIGLTGMTPPRSLQRLLGLKHELTDQADTSRHNELMGRKVLLRSGAETEVQTSPVYRELTLDIDGESKTFSNARTVFHIRLERLQDGWVKLHLTPEIHYGSPQLRPIAGDTEWQLRSSQLVETFHDLTFNVTLNVGEMVVLSSDLDDSSMLGHQFFVDDTSARHKRSLVVLRLTDMNKLQPLYEN